MAFIQFRFFEIVTIYYYSLIKCVSWKLVKNKSKVLSSKREVLGGLLLQFLLIALIDHVRKAKSQEEERKGRSSNGAWTVRLWWWWWWCIWSLQAVRVQKIYNRHRWRLQVIISCCFHSLWSCTFPAAISIDLSMPSSSTNSLVDQSNLSSSSCFSSSFSSSSSIWQ